MELVKIAEEIQKKIRLLAAGRKILKVRAYAKAEAIANYERAIAKTLIQLKNEKIFEIDGNKIEKPPATYAEKIAKGLCYDEKIICELEEAKYKNAIVGMQAIQAELNGYQSIFRYLDEVEKETKKGAPPPVW